MPTIYLLIAMLLCILFHFLIPIVYILPVPWNLLGIIPLIGIVFTMAASIYTTVVSGHLFGQIGQIAGGSPKEKGYDAPAM